MSRFIQKPRLQPDGRTDCARRKTYLTESLLKFQIGGPQSKAIIEVPIRTRTNLATIPTRFLRWVFRGLTRPDSPHVACVVLHDRITGEFSDDDGFTRSEADMILRIAMKASGYPMFKRTAVYFFVRFFAYLTLQFD